MKLYCKQVAPEYQESNFSLYGKEELFDIYNGIIITGNNDFNGLVTNEWEQMEKAINEGIIYDELEYCNGSVKEYRDILESYFYFDQRLTDEQVISMEKVLMEEMLPNRKLLAKLYGYITGKVYDYKQITGCVQRDWNYIYFPVSEYTEKQLEYIEIEYFNNGNEYIVYETDETIDSVEQLKQLDNCDFYQIYTHEYNEQKELEEIKGYCYSNIDDIIIFRFAGYKQIACYEKV